MCKLLRWSVLVSYLGSQTEGCVTCLIGFSSMLESETVETLTFAFSLSCPANSSCLDGPSLAESWRFCGRGEFTGRGGFSGRGTGWGSFSGGRPGRGMTAEFESLR